MNDLDRGLEILMCLLIYGLFIGGFLMIALVLFPWCLIAIPFLAAAWGIGKLANWIPRGQDGEQQPRLPSRDAIAAAIDEDAFSGKYGDGGHLGAERRAAALLKADAVLALLPRSVQAQLDDDVRIALEWIRDCGAGDSIGVYDRARFVARALLARAARGQDG